MGAAIFLVFVFGTIIGSFLNVVVDRADTPESPWSGRSFCPHCRRKLRWWELIPVLSFFILQGKCASCHKKISWQYPAVEAGTGLIFALLFWRFCRFPFVNLSLLHDFTGEHLLMWLILAVWWYWAAVLIVVSVYDLKKYLILNEALMPAMIFSFFWKIFLGFLFARQSFYFAPDLSRFLGEQNFLFGHYSYFTSMFLGMACAGGIIAFLAWATQEKAMGWGDAVLAVFLGIILGWPETLIALIVSFLIGGIVALVLICLKKKSMKSYLPFAPFLSLGTLTVMCFGDIIMEQYLSLLL